MVTVGSILGGVAGFIRANLRSIALWLALYLVFTVLMRLGLAPFYAAQVAAADATAQGLPVVAPAAGGFVPIFLLMLLLMVVLYNAVFRAVLFPQERAAAYLRVGMDEVRLLGLLIVLVAGFFAAMLVGGFLIGIVGTVVALLLGASPQGTAQLVSFGLLVLWIVLVGVGIRLSVAAPLTLYRRQIVIGPAWRLVEGRFWRLLGANVVVALAVIVLMLLVMVPIMAPMIAALGHPGDTDAMRRLVALQAAQMQFDASPLHIVWLLVSSVIGGLIVTLFGALPAVATVQLLDQKGRIGAVAFG